MSFGFPSGIKLSSTFGQSTSIVATKRLNMRLENRRCQNKPGHAFGQLRFQETRAHPWRSLGDCWLVTSCTWLFLGHGAYLLGASSWLTGLPFKSGHATPGTFPPALLEQVILYNALYVCCGGVCVCIRVETHMQTHSVW